MFCKNCGLGSDGNKKFCTNCGTAFSSSQSISPASVTHPSVEKNPGTKKIVKTALILASVFEIIIFWVINSIDSSAINKNNNALDAYNLGNADEAANQFREAYESATTNSTKIETLVNLAYAYDRQGNTELALNTFKEALALSDTDSVNYYLISGEIAELENKPNAALLAYNKGYAKDKEDYRINNSLGLFYLDLYDKHPQYTDYSKAVSYAQKVDQLSSSNVSKENLAIAYYFNENYSQTINILRALDLTNKPVGSYYLGLAYAEIDDVINAKFYLKQAIAGGLEVPQEVIDYITTY